MVDLFNAFVVDRIVNEFTIALRVHNACPSKDGKMLGCNGLFEPAEHKFLLR